MELLLGAANVFLQRERPLAAAVAATVALRDGFDGASPALLATLGTALARSAGVFVRKPFFEHAAKVFVRCKALGDPKYGPIADEWLGQLRAETPVDGIAPHRRDELPELLRFLDVDENYLRIAATSCRSCCVSSTSTRTTCSTPSTRFPRTTR